MTVESEWWDFYERSDRNGLDMFICAFLMKTGAGRDSLVEWDTHDFKEQWVMRKRQLKVQVALLETGSKLVVHI
jgi:hypothetical protein